MKWLVLNGKKSDMVSAVDFNHQYRLARTIADWCFVP